MSRKIQTTRNYDLLVTHADENRPLDVKKHKALVESMTTYGFLECFPLVVFRDDDGKLVIKDGQHRHTIAQTLGLPIHFIETDKDFDVATINSAAKPWSIRDYAEKHVANGIKHYQEGLEFAERHALPVGTAFALLAGTVSFGNVQDDYRKGVWVVRDRKWAESVAGIYSPLVQMSPAINNARFIQACMAVCRVKEFDPARLLACAERCREKLVPYSNRDAYMAMLEDVYNYGRKMFPLKVAAIQAMRDRNSGAITRAAKQSKKDGQSPAIVST